MAANITACEYIQIWMRISVEDPEPENDQAKFSFLSFAKTLIWWQKAPQNFKIEGYDCYIS